MNVLITNIGLGIFSGTVSYVYELALALRDRGDQVEIFSPGGGATAEDLKALGIHVVEDINKLKNTPDIIHIHHNFPGILVLQKFKDVPAIYFLHDRLYIYDRPIIHKKILKYIAVDYNCLERLLNAGIREPLTAVIFNWVNLDRFKCRNEFAEKPIRALVFSNYAKKHNHLKLIQQACRDYGIGLDTIGYGSGNYNRSPENALQQYELVFAKAKAAMEAMATGAAVILCDYRGLGEMVTPANFSYLRKFNFGMKTLTRPIDKELIIAEIKKFSQVNNRMCTELIREEASFEKIFAQLTTLYQDTISDYKKGIRGIGGNRLAGLWLELHLRLRQSILYIIFMKLIRRIGSILAPD